MDCRVQPPFPPLGARWRHGPLAHEPDVGIVQLSGIAVDGSGNIYMADTKNHRIVKPSSSGSVVATWGQKGIGANDFYYPCGAVGERDDEDDHMNGD